MQEVTYKKLGYLREYFDTLDARSRIDIPIEDLNFIRNQCGDNISYKNIRNVLRKCRWNKYYDDIPKIYEIINGNPVPKISKENKEILFESIYKFASNYVTSLKNIKYKNVGINLLNVNFIIRKKAKELNIQLPPMSKLWNYPDKYKKYDELYKKVNWNIKYGEICKILEQHLLNILLKRNYAAIKLQTSMRQMVAKRYLQRLKIGRELEYYPNIGIKYFEAYEHFNNLI